MRTREEVNHQSAYLGLAPADVAWHDELMSMPISAWPSVLRAHISATRPIYNGDQLACEVAAWMRTQPPGGVPC